MDLKDVLLIGVDGGATEVKAHAVACDDVQVASAFELREESASRVYAHLPDFEPTSITEQLIQSENQDIRLSPSELQQGQFWIEAAAQAIVAVAGAAGARRVLIGMGMPGLKTEDGRGIAVINNGPRMPRYLEALEKSLASSGIELVAPIAALGSDADYCGLGEEFAAEGAFRDVQHAYYLGGGTGIADALKLRGELVPFDQTRSWLLKSWQVPSALGPTFEKLASAKSVNRIYANLRINGMADFPEAAARDGQPLAAAWMDTVALVLAELLFERLWTVKNGRPDASHRGAGYMELDTRHPYHGTLLERLIVGQRIGQIYADETCREIFRDRLDRYVASFLAACGDAALEKHCLADGAEPTLRDDLIVPSRLRAAPALGAAVAAVRALP